MDKTEIREKIDRNLDEWRKLRPQIGDFLCHIDGTITSMESEQNNFDKRYLEIQKAIWRITGSEHLPEGKLGGNELMFIFNTNHIVNILSNYSLNSIIERLDTYDAYRAERNQETKILRPTFHAGDAVQHLENRKLVLTVHDVVFENGEEFFWAEVVLPDEKCAAGRWTEWKFRAAEFIKFGGCQLEEGDEVFGQ